MAISITELFAKINGIKSTGFAEMADVGLTITDWYVLPKNMFIRPKLNETKQSEMSKAYLETVAKINSMEDLIAAKKANKIVSNCVYDKGNIEFADGGVIKVGTINYTDAMGRIAMNSMLRHYAKLEKNDRMLKATANLLAICRGLIQFSENDEITVIEEWKEKEDHPELKDLCAFIDSSYSSVFGLMLASGITHWLTNHTVGNMSSSNILMKTWNLTALKTIFPEKGASLNNRLYNVFHPINKRNALYAARTDVYGIKALYTYGMATVEQVEVDKAFCIRIGGLPSGNRKLELAIALIKEVRRNQLLICTPNHRFIEKVLESYVKCKSLGVLAHVGARYYTKYAKDEGSYVDCVNNETIELIRSLASIIRIVQPDHTLLKSPVINNILNSGSDIHAENAAKALIRAYYEVHEKNMSEIVKSIEIENTIDIKKLNEKVDANIAKAEDDVEKFVKTKVVVAAEELKE